jgi:predicted NUDIX family phosphoesterase
MPEVQTEQVLVVPTAVFHALGHFQGFSTDVARYLEELLSPENTRYLPRWKAEEDPGYKQLIPYVILQHVDPAGRRLVFQYTRGKGQGEGRLHSKRSVGIGGHISETDVTDQAIHPYHDGMERELGEEIAIHSTYRQRCVGLINDDETPVGRVHLGVVHVFDLDRPAVEPREADILESGFRPVEDLLADLTGFESWSQICLRELFGQSKEK